MAKKLNAKTVEEAQRVEAGVKAEDLGRVIKEANRQKKIAAEYAQNHAAVVRQAIETHGLNKWAFGVVRKLESMEQQDREAAIGALMDYASKMGFFDQADMFSPVAQVAREIADRAQDRTTETAPKGRRVAPEMDAVLN